MASYRFSASVISRKSGRSATAAAAYRAAAHIECDRYGEEHDYRRKQGVLHAEIMAPDNAPDWMRDRAALWNAVEIAERRGDAQLAREIQLSLPHELNDEQRRELARAFVAEQFVTHGMIADLAIHVPGRDGDDRNHHAHVMLTMRELTGEGFGKKNRSWNDRQLLEQWREEWAHHQNRTFERLGINAEVTHESYADRGIDREPEQHMGPAAAGMSRKGHESRIAEENEAVKKRNADRAENHRKALLVNMDRQRARFEEWAARRAGELESAQQLSMLDLLRDQERAQGDLSDDLAQTYGPHLKTVETELSAVEQRLGQRGFARLWRSVTGKNRADRERLQKLQWTVEDAYLRMQEQRDKLADAQRAERERVEALQAERRHNVDAGIERARQKKEETLRAHQHDAALSPEDAAQHRTGVEATTQAAAVQSLAERARQAAQEQGGHAKNENTRTPDRGRDRGSGPEHER